VDTREAGRQFLRRIVFFGAAAAVFVGLYLSSRYSYLLFHTMAEMFSVAITCGIFMIAWNARHFMQNNYLLVLGTAFLAVAALDLAHTLAYKGMNVLPVEGANPATELWIAARFTQAVSLLLAPFALGRRLLPEVTLTASIAYTLLLILSIFVWDVFPDCYVEGEGLTAFKKLSEYVICFILAGAIASLRLRRHEFDPGILRLLTWAIVVTIVSELAFASYISVYGPYNLIGHMLKIVAVYLVYKAIIETGLARPYALLLRKVMQNEAELERLVHERTARLRELVGELEHFSYAITHDMRAPLRAMHGFGALLKESCGEDLSPECRGYLQRIITSAARMDKLITDSLHYSAAVRRELALSRVKTRELLQGIIDSYPNLHASKANIFIEGEIPEVRANEAGLTQCFSNLLDNAVKFVAPGVVPTVRIRAEICQHDGSPAKPAGLPVDAPPSDPSEPPVPPLANAGPMVRIWFEDNGIGIPPAAIPRLFNMFQRLSGEYEGTGIGLALVRKMAERMGGRAGVESEPGKGSRFWLELKPA